MALRIGVNALYLIPGKVGGTEIYLRNALSTLAEYDWENEYFILRNRETGTGLTPDRDRFHDCPQQVSAESRPARILYEQFVLPQEVRRLQLDVLWNAGFTAPLFCGCPMITTFYDLQYIHHPEFFRWFDLPFWRILLPLSAKRSRRVWVLSQAVKNDVTRFYRIPDSRMDYIPHAVEKEWSTVWDKRSRESPGWEQSGNPFILSVSTLHPHKNIDTLLRAFQKFSDELPGEHWRLCLAGLKGFDAERIERLQRELGLQDAVMIAGWVPREELYRLFATADAFVYPSRFEGFGIPVLEALTAGVPTACSRIPSLLEIAGEAVRYFDPADVNDMAAALRDVTGDFALRDRLHLKGRERARLFSRSYTAEQMIAAFRNTAQPATRSKNRQD